MSKVEPCPHCKRISCCYAFCEVPKQLAERDAALDAAEECLLTAKDSISSYAMQTYDRHGVEARKIQKIAEALEQIRKARSGK